MPKKKKKLETARSPDKKKDTIKGISLILKGHDASYIKNMQRTLISWSPAFDEILGGGIVSGGMTNMIGNPKVGKTSALLELVANCQKPENGGKFWSKEAAKKRGLTPGRPVFFYNVEGRFTQRDLDGTKGLNQSPDKFEIFSTTLEQRLYLENCFTSIEQQIEAYPGCVILIDSIGALCTTTVATVTDSGQVRDNAPLLTSSFMKRIGGLLMPYDIVFLNVLHKVSNTGASQFEKKTLVTGGKKFKYGANNIVEITHSQLDGDHKGCYILHLESETSEVGEPFVVADAYLRFGKGLWHEYELACLITGADTQSTFGIAKSGSWYTIDAELTGTGESVKVQGIHTIAKFLEDNPKAYNNIYKAYKAMYWPNASMYTR